VGRTSVRYEIAVFRPETAELLAFGWFVHVFVDRASRRPAPIPERLRAALERFDEPAQAEPPESVGT
jgi:acyl-CoA thioester hydrolase